jgi:four helix bundle protein
MTYDVTTPKKRIESFTDLHTWQEGHKLVVMVYQKTKSWPKDEDYGLRSQIRRAIVSVTSNIAEGFSRETAPDQTHFYVMAKASLTEVQNQLLVARDVEYTSVDEFNLLADQSDVIHRLLIGLIRASKAGKGARR